LPIDSPANDATPDDSETDQAALETVVVVATKRERSLADLPLAVSAVSGETLDRAFVRDLIDLQTLVPSLRVNQLQNRASTIFSIRGFGNGPVAPGLEPSVGIFIDGVYRSRAAAALADLHEVDRIEILRGPQSTLFGKTASAGVLNVVTALPDMNEFRGLAEITAPSFDGYWLRGNFNGPISQTLGFGMDVNAADVDGYFGEFMTGTELKQRDRWGVRGQLVWLPSDDVGVRFIADSDRINELCCGVANLFDGPTGEVIRTLGGRFVANDAFAYENFLSFLPENVIENSGVSLQSDIDLGGGLELTSITARRQSDQFSVTDADYTSARFIGVEIDERYDTFTQELRLAQSEEALSWMIGAFWLEEDVRFDSAGRYGVDGRPYFDLLTGGAITELENALSGLDQLPPGLSLFGVGQGWDIRATQKEETVSLFGQLDWRLTDRLTLTLGANHTEADKAVSLRSSATELFSSVDLVRVGFGAAFFQLTGLPPARRTLPAIPKQRSRRSRWPARRVLHKRNLRATQPWHSSRCSSSRRFWRFRMPLSPADPVTLTRPGPFGPLTGSTTTCWSTPAPPPASNRLPGTLPKLPDPLWRMFQR